MHCTQDELAGFFGVSLSTIERLFKTPDGEEAAQRGYNLGKIRVRRQQLNLLKEGNVTMAIWLGKQFLGQRDKVEQTLRTPPGDPLRIDADVHDRRTALLLTELFSPDEIAAARRKLQEIETGLAQQFRGLGAIGDPMQCTAKRAAKNGVRTMQSRAGQSAGCTADRPHRCAGPPPFVW